MKSFGLQCNGKGTNQSIKLSTLIDQ